MDLDGFASPARSSVWCSPADGFFFQKKHVPGILQLKTNLKPLETFLKHLKTLPKCSMGAISPVLGDLR